MDPPVLSPGGMARKVRVVRPDRQASRDILEIYLHSNIPLDPEAVAAHGGDREAARKSLIDEAANCLWRRNEHTEFLEVYLRNGSTERLYWKDLASGALLMSVVERAK